MPPKILMLNGASGSGKTTIAKPLSERLDAEWIHPDALWDPTTDQREATFRAVELACSLDAELVLIDKQFRHPFMLDAFAKHKVTHGNQILLHCRDEVRSKRLLQRSNWQEEMLENMLKWSDFLLDHAASNGVEVIDTSDDNPGQTEDKIVQIMHDWGWT